MQRAILSRESGRAYGTSVWFLTLIAYFSNASCLLVSFSPTTFLIIVLENIFCYHRICLEKAHRNIYMMSLEGEGETLTSGQGHDVTWIGQLAYHLMHLHKISTTVSLSHS